MAKSQSLLDGPCPFWPDCECAKKPERWHRILRRWIDPAEPAPTVEETDDAIFDIFLMLSCIAHGCPDRRIKRKAQIELLNRIYDKARAQCGVKGKPKWRKH